MISAVLRMEAHLAALPHAQTTNVVIFGNAVQTAAPIDLADPVQLADPVATLQTVVAQGFLKRNSCAGWQVYMVDGSLTPAGGLDAPCKTNSSASSGGNSSPGAAGAWWCGTPR